MDLAAFRAAFPEFANASDSLVETKLSEALAFVDSEIYGTSYNDAHGYMTAHLLTMSPKGRALARLETDKEATIYLRSFEALRGLVNGGWDRVC